jgi:formate dehydrogenase subunit gamma
MNNQEIVKYRLPVRILHWVHSGAFLALFFTGLILIIPSLFFLASNGWTRHIHILGAAIFLIAPLVYSILLPCSTVRGLRLACTWGREDIRWLLAAPRYYILGDEKAMPPQGFLNSGQKTWWLINIIFGFVSILTGVVRIFAIQQSSSLVLRWMVSIHDVSFIVMGIVFFIHIYVAVFHPLSKESWKIMTAGKISREYAASHHDKWYKEVTGDGAPPLDVLKRT